MKLIIDISEEVYNYIKRLDLCNMAEECIKNGTPLQEGRDQMAAKKTDKSIERGTELIPIGRLETQDAYLLEILKEQGFYLMYNKRETKFGELEYWQVLYPKEG